MVWFNDVLSMAAAFESKAVDVVPHVEPFATRLVDKLGGVALASNRDVWGKDGPDCVTNARADFIAQYPDATKKYLKALLRPTRRSRPTCRRRWTSSTRASTTASTRKRSRPRCRGRPPQVDLTRGGDKGMEIAIADMVTLGYLKKAPDGVIDFRLLRETAEELTSCRRKPAP